MRAPKYNDILISCTRAFQNEFDSLRNLCYPETDVFMLCFSVVQPESFESACTRWYKELQHQGAAVVLVGTQADLYQDPSKLQELRRKAQVPVSPGQARELANRCVLPTTMDFRLNIFSFEKT